MNHALSCRVLTLARQEDISHDHLVDDHRFGVFIPLIRRLFEFDHPLVFQPVRRFGCHGLTGYRPQSGSSEHFPDHQGAELDRRHIFKGPAELADRSPDAAYDDNFLHIRILLAMKHE